MKVYLQYQANESLPPDLHLQLKRAIAALVGSYGLNPAVSEDAGAELEAYQRFWQWKREQAEAGWPATPAESEVK